ncbi:MAG: leucine-rich repeat domain-containing protein [Christensenellales bacterium]
MLSGKRICQCACIPQGDAANGDFAFSGCSQVDIVIPDSAAMIGDCAFAFCNSLTSIAVPNSVTMIENSAFDNCNVLTLRRASYAGPICKRKRHIVYLCRQLR